MLARMPWQAQTVIICTLIVVLGALALFGQSLGVSPETLRHILGGSAVVSTIGAWLMKSPGAQ